jgi:chaperonin GroEL
MSKKIIKYGSDARKSLQVGINTVVKAVQTSFGPAGRTSVIGQSYGGPSITNDGVTIAKSIELEGVEQAGVSLMQQAANKTNDEAGDGTTTTTILAGSLINEGLKMVEAGSDPVKLRGGMKKAIDFTLKKLSEMSKPITTLDEKANVATISSRSESIGKMVAQILEEVGNDGVVTVQSGDTNEITMEITQGMQFDKGYKSPYFVTDTNKMEAIVEKALILITDQKITSIQDVLPVIEDLASKGKKDLMIIADDIDGEALATFILNKVRGLFNVYAVQAPSFGDTRKAILEDISVLTGATLISGDLGMKLKDAKFDDLGAAEKVIITKDTTTIVGGKGDKDQLEKRISILREALNESKSDYDKTKINERLAKLAGGVGILKVGAATEVEMKELKYIVEDALNATKAAIAEGVVPGGASTLVRLSKSLDELNGENDEENLGINIVKKALLAPFRAIASNSGIYDIALILEQIALNSNSGYDFARLIQVEDMVSEGIIDPAKVVMESLINSSSIAGSVITTEVVVVDAPKVEKEDAGLSGSMSGMGF